MRNLTAILLTAAATAGFAFAQEKVDQRLPAASDAQISVENIAGSVIVSGSGNQEVQVTGTLGAGTEGLEFTGGRDRITIKVKYPQGDHHVNIGESNLTIKVPRGSRLSVETVSARIALTDFEGDSDLQSVSGDIRLDASPKNVDISTVSGTIRFSGKGELDRGDFKTVSGDVEADADFSSTGRFKFETVSGDVVLKVPRGSSIDFNVASFSGTIDNDFGETPRRTNQYIPSSELKFSVGGGGARVSIQTLSGKIRLTQP